MRKLAVCALFLAVTGMVAATSYDTVLYTDDPTADLRMYGELWPQYEAEEVEMTLKYSFEIENDAFNASKVSGFDLLVENGSGIVDRIAIDVSGLDIGQSGIGPRYETFTAPIPPETVTDIGFRINHTAKLQDGEEVMRQLEGSIDPDLRPPNRTLESFFTNQSSAYRDGTVFVQGNVSNIDSVTIGGMTLEADPSTFSGNVPLPDGLTTGQQDIPFTIETGTGHIFERSLSLDIMNRPPQLNISVPRSVQQGNRFDVSFDAIDDTGIASYAVRFAGEEVIGNTSPVTLGTEGVELGNHTVNATVTDEDEATAEATAAVSVVEEATDVGNGGSDDGGTDDGGSDDEDEEERGSSNIPIIGAFREFVTGLIRSLLGSGG